MLMQLPGKMDDFGLFIAIILIISLSSCVKQPGCIDPNASNYSFDAEKDDGSCLYDMHFWLSTAKYEGVEVYVDGVDRGPINVVLLGPPICGVDQLSYQNYHYSVIVPLNSGMHSVEVRAFDGTIFREDYYLPENCLSIAIAEHE